jgi:hypothetical protein
MISGAQLFVIDDHSGNGLFCFFPQPLRVTINTQ